ncbi:hypothetical protein HHK36_003310 [Tetracentron sinense]|uniref:Large ribosomal subunit protein uL4m n=1 Tax=Tetracentron sinense TaxID=13715 RepID=A0A835DNI9_TETSI|nr:hypothetical protein HHK36_003310 [Tetracentron sinense]
MAMSISIRLLRSFGPSSARRCCESSMTIERSLRVSNAFYGHVSGDNLSALESSFFCKRGLSFPASRGLSTSILTPHSGEGAFPSELLSKKAILTPERTPGCYEDLIIPVTNFHNEDKGLMVLAGDVFDVPIRKDIVHRVVRWQLAKRQQGTHSTKTISEVSGTGRKPWPQKGTGRARHGTLRGPQFRHGATMHGPKPRSHAIKLQKKVRRLGLKIALSARIAEGKCKGRASKRLTQEGMWSLTCCGARFCSMSISPSSHDDISAAAVLLFLLIIAVAPLLIFDDLEVPTHKTKNIVNYVSQMENTKKLLLVDGGPINEKLKLATQNLHYVNLLPSIGLNVYSILLHDTLVMSRDAVDRIVKRMHTPINR